MVRFAAVWYARMLDLACLSKTPNRYAIRGPDIWLGDTIVSDYAVLVANGRTTAVIRVGEIPEEIPVRTLPHGLLAPGFIDLHTHGAGGRGFNESDPDAYRQALPVYLQAGVTTLLPSLSSAPLDELLGALAAFDTVRADLGLPRMPGVHLEGPYFSHDQRGAQDPEALRNPDDGSIDQILEHASNIRMISFAPELPGAVALASRLVGLGIVAAAGHSNGRDSDLESCQRAGLSHVIHIVSGQSTTVREGPWRRPGMLEATLASQGLTVEMIADGKHLPPTLMRLAYRCLAGRLCLVSDSTPGAGLPDGQPYRLGSKNYVVEDGVGMTPDRTSFAGSTTLVSQMLPIAIDTIGMSVVDAIAMVTSIPATAAGLGDVGRIAPGYRADFVLLDDSYRPAAVALGGVWQ